MKWLLKLLKDHTIAGKDYKTGDTIETDNKELAGQLLADGICERAEPDQATKSQGDNGGTNGLNDETKDFVKAAIDEAFASIGPAVASKHVSVEVHDKSDDDGTWGYCPQRNRKHSRKELEVGLGEFAKDVYKASDPSSRGLPERLSKCYERGQKQVEEAVKAGYMSKAAGDIQQVGSDADGGFTVPPDFSLMLNEASLEDAVVRPRATVIQTSSDRIELPQPKNYDHSSNLLFGGVEVFWKGEDDQLVESKVQWEQIALNLNPLTAMVKVTHKMMRFSSVTVGSFILPMIGQAIGWKEDDGFINGTGAGMPLGILQSPCKVEIAKETGQTAATVVSENIDKVFGAWRKRGTDRVGWIYNHSDLWDDLASLERAVGTGGGPAGLVQQLGNTPQMSIYGLPLLDTEHCAAAGTAGDIAAVDFKDYLIADDQSGLELAQSMHLHFDYGREVFRAIKYTDGGPRYTSTFTRQKSTQATGPFVTIAARA